MERLIQYLDDFEDVLFAAALVGERVHRVIAAVLGCCLVLTGLISGVALALSRPPLALAVVSLLMVTLLYRATVNQPRRSLAKP